MYRDGSVYDEIDKVIFDIYQDYGIKTFPVDEVEVCNKLGVALVPYSAFLREEGKLLIKKSELGFFVKESKEQPPTIYYNDRFSSKGAIRLMSLSTISLMTKTTMMTIWQIILHDILWTQHHILCKRDLIQRMKLYPFVE